MSDILKATLILSAAMLLAVIIMTYFSPYHSCVRTYGNPSPGWVMRCAEAVGGQINVTVEP